MEKVICIISTFKVRGTPEEIAWTTRYMVEHSEDLANDLKDWCDRFIVESLVSAHEMEVKDEPGAD